MWTRRPDGQEKVSQAGSGQPGVSSFEALVQVAASRAEEGPIQWPSQIECVCPDTDVA
jgi:hypothetical protein